MSLDIEVQKRPPVEISKQIKVDSTNEVYCLKEVQEIKDALQEHLLFVGLDNRNNIKCIRVLGIGSSSGITVDSKEIVRTALLTAVEKVILVHNHPSNSLEPSKADKHFTNFTAKVLETFNIELLDHVIVTENNYSSLKKLNAMNKNFKTKNTKTMDYTFLLEENIMLKKELKQLKAKLSNIMENNNDFEEENVL